MAVRLTSLICFILLGMAVTIGSMSGGGGDDEKDNYDGTWHMVTYKDCLGHVTDVSEQGEYFKIEENIFRSYECPEGKCTYCAEDDTELSEFAYDTDLSDDVLTISFNNQGCDSTMIFEPSQSSKISGADELCTGCEDSEWFSIVDGWLYIDVECFN